MIVIYEISDPTTSEPRYIGQTNNFLYRKNSHLSTARKCTNKGNWRLYSFIKNLLNQDLQPVFTIIDIIENQLADLVEMYWIAQYKQWGFNLFNIAEGGLRPTNRIAWNKGLTLSQDHKDALSKSHIGLIQSEEHIENRFKSLRLNGNPRLGTIASFETKQKIKDSRKNRRAVRQLSLEGHEIEVHSSLTAAKEKIGASSFQSISYCCDHKPKHNTAYGYKWEFV